MITLRTTWSIFQAGVFWFSSHVNTMALSQAEPRKWNTAAMVRLSVHNIRVERSESDRPGEMTRMCMTSSSSRKGKSERDEREERLCEYVMLCNDVRSFDTERPQSVSKCLDIASRQERNLHWLELPDRCSIDAKSCAHRYINST